MATSHKGTERWTESKILLTNRIQGSSMQKRTTESLGRIDVKVIFIRKAAKALLSANISKTLESWLTILFHLVWN